MSGDETVPPPRTPPRGFTPVGSPRLRAFGVALGWLLAGTVLTAAMLAVDLHHNLFDWTPRVEAPELDVFAAAAIVLSLPLCWWLGRRTRGAWLLAIAALVLAWLLFIGIAGLPSEELNPGRMLGRDTPSPGWYRWGRLAVLALPSAVLLYQRPWRRKATADERPARD